MTSDGMQRDKLNEEINKAIDKKEYQQVLLYLDELIKIDGETTELLDYKFDLLMRLGKYQQALEVIPKLDTISIIKPPWNCLKAADAHLYLGNHDKAMEWIEKAITERASRRANVFNDTIYDSLRADPHFIWLVTKARENAWLGKMLRILQ